MACLLLFLLCRMGLSFYKSSIVTMETMPPFIRFMGATANNASVVTLLMEGLMAWLQADNGI